MINSFKGKYDYLSNFFPAPVEFEGVIYPTVEHAYQAAKTLDPGWRFVIFEAHRPAAWAKKIGQRVPIRPDWEQIKLQVMYDLVKKKFSSSDELKRLLIDTGEEELIEGNWWGDQFWGVCRGVGENHLGKILMKVRHELRTQSAVVTAD